MTKQTWAGRTLSLLRAIRRNGLFFGAFLILQGIALYITRGGSPVNYGFAVLSALMIGAVAIEWIEKLLKLEKTWIRVMLGLLGFACIAALTVAVIAMIWIPEVRLKNLMLIVSIIAVFSGSANIVRSVRIEQHIALRSGLIFLSVLCIGFGISYWMTYERAPDMLIRARGIILIITGAIDMWLGVRSGQPARLKSL